MSVINPGPSGIDNQHTECLELLISRSRNIRAGPRLGSSVRVAAKFKILETGTLEIMLLLSNPELAEKLKAGKNTPLSECIPESEVNW